MLLYAMSDLPGNNASRCRANQVLCNVFYHTLNRTRFTRKIIDFPWMVFCQEQEIKKKQNFLLLLTCRKILPLNVEWMFQ